MATETPTRNRIPFSRTSLLLITLLALSMASYLAKDVIYRVIATTTASSPFLSTTATILTEPGLILLTLVTGGVAVWSWFRSRRNFLTLAAGGVGVIGAYLASELMKMIFSEERPCHALDVATVLVCPEVGDWSWPSNHSVIAAGFATAVALAAPRLIWFAAPIAIFVALSRIAVGAHYLHDVLAGLALGVGLVFFSVHLLRPVVSKLKITREPI